MMRRSLALALVLAGFASAARADIMFTSDPVDTDINVLDLTKTSATTATGRENAGDDLVVNIKTDQELVAISGGQARVEAADAAALFQTIIFTPQTLFGFTTFELNPQIASGSGDSGTFQLIAEDQFGNIFTSLEFLLGNGDNRVAAVASNGQLITKLTLVASDPIVNDIRQIRIGGVTSVVVPEPSSIALVSLGLTTLGLAGWRRRRTASV